MSEIVGYGRWGVEVDKQTNMRGAAMFWINQLRWGAGNVSLSPTTGIPEGAKQGEKMGVWLVRSLANPNWHGIESDVPSGEAPLRRLQDAADSVYGNVPKHLDPVAIVQPGELSGVRRTTYIYNAVGDVLPRPKLPGIELGFFPIDDLPEAQLDPRYQNWLSPMLQQSVIDGMRNPITYVGPPYNAGPPETIIFDSSRARF